MSKQVYISADYAEYDGDRDVVEELNKWGSDNFHKVDFIDMSKVASGSVSKDPDCRICDLKQEFNRQINASSAVIFVVGDKTALRTAGSACRRSGNDQSSCNCTPYKQNTNGTKSCKVFFTSTPGENDDDDVPPPAQENAPEPLPGGMVVKGFFSSRVTIQQLDLSGVTESGIGPMVGSVKASDAGEDLTSRGAVLIESAAPRSTVTTDIPSLREDGVEDIFFRYEDTMTHYSVDKMADAAGEDADVELKQNKEDINLRLDGETRDDLSERYLEWVPVQTPEPQERLILTHEGVEQKTSEELRRERDELRKQELDMMDFQLAKKRDDLPSLDWWLEPAREETVKQKTSEELRRELDELRKQELEMGFQFAKKRDDLPSLDWWLEPARTETPGIGLDESLKQLAARFEDIAPEEDKKPLLFLVEPSGTERKKYINPLESDLRRYTDLSDDWDDQPDTQGEIKIWIPEDLGQPKEISILKESLSGSDGIA